VWLASALSFDVLVRAAHFTGLYTYKEIAIKAWGKPLALFAELCIMLYTFLNLISRPIIISSYLKAMFASWAPHGPPILQESWLLIILVSIVMYPLTFLRNIDALKYSSFFSVLCVVFTAVVVVFMFAITPDLAAKVSMAQDWPDSASALISLGIMVVSFCAHYNAPRMYMELQNRSVGRMRVVIGVSTLLCFLLYALVGVTGYLSCLTLTQDNVLEDYGANVVLVTVARVALVVALIFSTPLVLFACRRSFLVVFLPSRVSNAPFWLWISISGGLLILAGVIAANLPNIGIIFGFSGSLLGVWVVFLIPGVFFILLGRAVRYAVVPLNDGHFVGPEHTPSSLLLQVTGWILVAVALTLGPLGTVGAVFRLVSSPNTTALCYNTSIAAMEL
jgi:amino acid permease